MYGMKDLSWSRHISKQILKWLSTVCENLLWAVGTSDYQASITLVGWFIFYILGHLLFGAFMVLIVKWTKCNVTIIYLWFFLIEHLLVFLTRMSRPSKRVQTPPLLSSPNYCLKKKKWYISPIETSIKIYLLNWWIFDIACTNILGRH